MAEITGFKHALYRDRLVEALGKLTTSQWDNGANFLFEAWQNDFSVFVAGNGGSAATANHFVVDWSKGLYERTGKAMLAVSLVTNLALMTAISNDNSFEAVFSTQIEHLMRGKCCIVIISGSGNSKNVINLAEFANSNNIPSLSLTGFDGGKLAKLTSINVHVSSNDMQIVEDVHSSFGHFVLEYISKNY